MTTHCQHKVSQQEPTSVKKKKVNREKKSTVTETQVFENFGVNLKQNDRCDYEWGDAQKETCKEAQTRCLLSAHRHTHTRVPPKGEEETWLSFLTEKGKREEHYRSERNRKLDTICNVSNQILTKCT